MLFKLALKKLNSGTSAYKGEVITRAANEKEAREEVALRFSQAVKVDRDAGTALSPWGDADLVSCEIIMVLPREKASHSG